MKSPNSKGFTLIEMTVATAVIAILSLLITLVISRGFAAYRYNLEAIRMQDSAAKAMRDFESKTRGAEQIIKADAEELVYYAYIAGDVRPAPSRIRYFYNNGELKRGIISPSGTGPTYTYPEESETIASEATGVLSDQLFSYYSDQEYSYTDDTITMLASPADIASVKLVRINLQIDYHPDKPPIAANESTLVNLRNLKRNL